MARGKTKTWTEERFRLQRVLRYAVPWFQAIGHRKGETFIIKSHKLRRGRETPLQFGRNGSQPVGGPRRGTMADEGAIFSPTSEAVTQV